VRHDFDVTEVLAKPLMAHLASHSAAGPRDSPLWFLWEEEAIWLIGRTQDSFVQRLRLEPRCAVGVVDFDVGRGVLRHVGIRGTAEIQSMCEQRLQRLLRRYLGDDMTLWNAWFVAHVVEPLDAMIRVIPHSIVANNYSYFKTGPETLSA
jgi:Pyridoxamine 5'-phosphate oxidase